MRNSQVIILSQDLDFIEVCESLAAELKIENNIKYKLANFLLSLQENDYQVALLDCKHLDMESLKWVQVVHRIRPKIPLIIISDEVDQNTGGKVYEEGTFYLYIRPVVKSTLKKVLMAALSPSQVGESNRD